MKAKVLGTVQLGIPYGINNGVMPDRDYSIELLENAYDNGIRFLDTARAYGESLEVIGDYHSKKPEKKFEVFSKFMLQDILTTPEDLVIDQCSILNVDKIHGMYFHRFNDYLTSSKIITCFKNSIYLRNVGVSLYNSEEFLKASLDGSIDILQLPLSIFHHHSSLKKNVQESVLKQKIYLRSIYLQGLLFLPKEKLTGKLAAFIPVINFFQNISNDMRISLQELAGAYAMDLQKVEGVLFGAETIKQVEENNKFLKPRELDWEYLFKNMPIVDEALLNPGNWK